MKFVFEVSWEVCNKVGGIHTVIASKAREAVRAYGEGYIAVGPDLGQNAEFEESDIFNDEFFARLKPILDQASLPCRFGRWKIPGSPRVILVGGFKERFNIERLFYAYWDRYRVNSYGGSWDYLEPVLFSTACAELIDLAYKNVLNAQDKAVAHFHEWMCGAGILYLDNSVPQVGTIFTTHATVLGRALAHGNPYYYDQIELGSDPSDKAYKHGVESKHSMESVCARVSDCFTTVSEITARESYLVLGRRPDLVVYNGLNTKELPLGRSLEHRRRILDICGSFFEEKLPDNTKIWISSGRYEFINKGYDLVIESLSKLKEHLSPDADPILMLFLVAADQQKVPTDYQFPKSTDKAYRPVNISPVYNLEHDAIVNACKHFGLDKADSPVRVAFSALYLDGNDGIFNLSYQDILKSADLSLFPSFYEPWGYTPLESAVRGIPTITSDLAGFGHWIQTHEEDFSALVKVLNRRHKSADEAILSLTEILIRDFIQTKPDAKKIEAQADSLRMESDWGKIYKSYKAAYNIALAKAHSKEIVLRTVDSRNSFVNIGSCIPGNPSLRCSGVEISLPDNLTLLNELAYNLWWSWHDEAQEFFALMNPTLWEYFNHNPVKLLKSISTAEWLTLRNNSSFVDKYHSVCDKFKAYLSEMSIDELIDPTKPVIAYFSMEYGIHESLPIYSGGLGILSGDHMKAASDLNLNMIGLGLFYHQGYFMQEINESGYQIEHYPVQDWRDLSLKLLANQYGEPIKIQVEFSGRVIWTRVLVAQVGRVPVFLFDTNIDENGEEDRQITARLYVSDREARIKQETLIAIAGIRLVKDVLNLEPSVYHLNEGHCAFIAVERARRLCLQGFSFETAIENIKSSTVFTTHTPVPAGNETFALDLVKKTFGPFFNSMHVPIEKLLDLGIESQDKNYDFSMTVFAIRTSAMANAVSALHKDVSIDMWKNVFPADDPEYFSYVTNGVHMDTWMGKEIKTLDMEDLTVNAVWEAHKAQKEKLIDALKSRIKEEYTRRGVNNENIKKVVTGLNPDSLLIGFARRFAEYKRANLLFRDAERLKSILAGQNRPVTVIYAGKSHPASGAGKELIQEIYRKVFDDRFVGKIIMLEGYSMHLARLLVQGVDIWLNTPIIRMEACGTSGMKAGMNGGLNLSIPDGWWAEGYAADRGWSIHVSQDQDYEQAIDYESKALYELLEKEILPLYYQRDDQGIPRAWAEKMLNSIKHISEDFSAERMLEDYEQRIYFPVINKNTRLALM
jgi:phosphorylase/glycogen(starch) synthase